ncbi:Glutamate dehydrogenase (NADP+) [Elusimicrobium minutum Pei191]|uniref:Glutamate dehydrogenase n=1 Tax=Elusimicrobium minutum (strain Pei191) TaxID=445932 RepID=B2KCG1_ELUMP|nr:NADP-specific glutamate dehydrogenase [Elusimicrobium minutum]ACC98082.1 Glutamate dehydrogenase (NADP+) [Elusimicrobium minutum Pei191]
MNIKNHIDQIVANVVAKDPDQLTFHQAVAEVAHSLTPVLERNPEYIKQKILERMIEPERLITFRVPWQDDKGEVHVNRGIRVQFNSAIGPYKGGLRFRPNVSVGMLKFLGFEQTFKNALTTLPMGGGKGGSDFDVKGKSDAEVMRFCQSFMTELFRHIGPNTDVPAGDLGVGAREIGYLYGQYKRLTNEFTGTFTGKSITWGGSLVRPEATGYGTVYFAQNMLATKGDSLKSKTCVISGAGNVGIYAIEKINHLGGKVVAFATAEAAIHDKDGVDDEKLNYLKDLVFVKRGAITEYAKKYSKAVVLPSGKKTWDIPCFAAFPTAAENELDVTDAKTLLKNGCECVSEGANMPCTPEAVSAFEKAGILYAPGKAANAGGVSVSGLEMSQNSVRLYWPREQVDAELQKIMKNIHDTALAAAAEYGMKGNYVAGANIAGFKKVATAMIEQGLV